MFRRKISAFLIAAGTLLSFNQAQADCLDLFCSRGCAPYACGTWTLGLQAGVDHTRFTRNSDDLFFDPLFPVGFPPFVVHHPQFKDQFRQPAIYGGYVGYMVRNSIELFVEGNYATASSKRFSFIGVDGDAFENKLDRYKYWDFYVGVRFYPYTCGCVAPFIGFKVGGAHRFNSHNDLHVTTYGGIPVTSHPIAYKGGTVVSGGGQIGLNFNLTDCIAIVIKGEVVVSGNWETPFLNVPVPTCPGSTGPIVSFPVTAGVRFSW